MANFSGKIGTPTDGFTLKVEYSYSQSIANNNSVISSIKGYCKKNNSSYYPYNSSKTATIKIERLDNSNNWVTVKTLSNTESYSFSGVSTSTYLEFVSGSNITIPHKTNGEQQIRITFNVDGKLSSYYPKGSISSSPKLTTIPRYATASQSLKSKTSSSITMNWSSDSTIDYIWYSKDNGSTWTGVDVTDGTSGSYTISGLSANTAYNIKTRVRRKDSQLTTDSSALSVTTYAKTVPTISLSSKTINSITVTSGCNVTVSSTQYRIKKSGGSYGNYQTSATFSGLDPNTSYVIEVKKVGTSSGESGTATLTVTTYQIATISSAPSFNLGNSQTITYSNPGGNIITTLQACISFTGALDDISYRDISKTGTSYTFNFTDTELDKLYKKFGTSNSFKAIVFIRTICNGITYHNTKEITVTLTGNQKTAHIGVNGYKKRAKVFIGVNGTVKRAVVWIGNNGRKRCI